MANCRKLLRGKNGFLWVEEMMQEVAEASTVLNGFSLTAPSDVLPFPGKFPELAEVHQTHLPSLPSHYSLLLSNLSPSCHLSSQQLPPVQTQDASRDQPLTSSGQFPFRGSFTQLCYVLSPTA